MNPLIALQNTNTDSGNQAFDTYNNGVNAAQTAALNQEKIAQAAQATRAGAQQQQFSNALINAAGINQSAQAAPQASQQQPAEPDRAVQIQENYAKLPEKEKTRLNSVLDAGAAITPLVDANDQQGTIKALQERNKELGAQIAKGADIHTEDTDAGIQQAKTDWDGFKQTHAGLIEVGQMLGYYKTRKDLHNDKGQDPAALKLTDAYQAALKSGDTQKANAILMFTKSLEKGQTLDVSGNVVAQSGALDTVQNFSNAKESGKQQAQLKYEPDIEGNKKKAASDAEFKAKAQQNLPQVLDNAEYLNTQLDGLLNAPGKKQAVGASSILPILPGTDAADFKARLEQINGEQFLQAFTSLKGGGQITEIEGKKATDAIARMQTSQTEPEFDKSVKEFKTIVEKATKRARAAAGTQGAYGNNTTGQTPAEAVAAKLPPENIQTGGSINALPQGANQAPVNFKEYFKYYLNYFFNKSLNKK